MKDIFGVDLLPAADEEIDELMRALAAADDGGPAPWPPPVERASWWLHVEQDDGYTVGRWDNGGWRLGRAQFPQLATWRPDKLHELRIFAPGAELLVHPTDAGWRGRWALADPQPHDGPLEPRRRQVVLASEEMTPGPDRAGFSLLRRADGTSSVAPVTWPANGVLVLGLREYFVQDPSGSVRVALSCLDGYHRPGEYEEPR